MNSKDPIQIQLGNAINYDSGNLQYTIELKPGLNVFYIPNINGDKNGNINITTFYNNVFFQIAPDAINSFVLYQEI